MNSGHVEKKLGKQTGEKVKERAETKIVNEDNKGERIKKAKQITKELKNYARQLKTCQFHIWHISRKEYKNLKSEVSNFLFKFNLP